VAEAGLQAARYSVQQAEASLSQARDNLAKTTIRAPMSGRVTRLNIEEGETAIIGTMNNPGSLLLTIADLAVMEAKVRVDETDLPRISVGDSAAVRIDAFAGQTFSGRVTRIANSALQTAAQQAGADQQSVDYEVVVTLDDPPDALRPDLSATAEIVTDRRTDALAIPIISLTVRDSAGKRFRAGDEEEERERRDRVRQAGGQQKGTEDAEVQGVFVVRDGEAEWVPVETGITGDEYFEVRRGLRGGETVVSGSFQAVRELEDGDPVRTEEAEGARGRGRGRRGA
jgi:HlyD family secretion protein